MDCAVCDNLPTSVKIEQLKEDAVDFATGNGIILKVTDGSMKGKPCTQLCIHTPFTLFPSPFPRSVFENLMELQLQVNKVIHLASQDEEFITENLKEISEADDFVRGLLEIYKTVKSSDVPVVPEFGLIRSDYMLNFDRKTGQKSIKQVENNIHSVTAAFGTQKMKQLHEYTLKRCGMADLLPRLPDNYAARDAAKVFVKAWRMYSNPDAVIVFLTSEKKTYVYDDRQLEYEIFESDPSIKMRWKTMVEMARDMIVDSSGRLFVNEEEVAILYYLTGFNPEHYTNEKMWQMRLDIEKSRAIKCPSVAYQLAETKKMQEVLARPGQLERFVDKEIAEKIRKTFTGLYTLDMNEAGDVAVEKALKNPENYVLKPQKEGGGHNFYNEDLVKVLEEIGNDKRRSAYILMDKIQPPSTRNYFVSSGSATSCDAVGEIGIYTAILVSGKDFVENKAIGHILRSKSKEYEDGGFKSGKVVLDSPLLVDI